MNRISRGNRRYILRSCGLLLSIATAGVGCATAVRGLNENVTISSVPNGATVIADGENVGVTPTSAKLSRNDSHSIRIEKAGYITYETKTGTKVSNGWRMADLPMALFFSPAVLIMLIDRGAEEIEPDAISANLIPLSSTANASAAAAPLSPGNTSPPAAPVAAARSLAAAPSASR